MKNISRNNCASWPEIEDAMVPEDRITSRAHEMAKRKPDNLLAF